MGATGLETDIGLTKDGVPVLIHPRPPFLGGMRVSQVLSRDLPGDVPTLADLYERCGTEFQLSLDMGEPQAAEAVVETAERFGAADRLWLTYWHLTWLEMWRGRWPKVQIVYATLPVLPRGRNALMERVSNAGVDALNVHHRFCTASLVRSVQAQGLMVFAWGIKRDSALQRVMGHGVDGVYCDNVQSMVDVL